MATARVASSGVACACPAVFVCAACLIACKTSTPLYSRDQVSPGSIGRILGLLTTLLQAAAAALHRCRSLAAHICPHRIT